MFPVFFEPVSAAFILLETAVIALISVMTQLKAILTPLLATVLQLKDQFNQPSYIIYLFNQILYIANRSFSV